MTIPFPKPVARYQARANAIHFAEAAAFTLSGQTDISENHARQARVWASIASTFPEDVDYEVVMGDDTPQFRVVEDRDPLEPEFDPRPMAERNGFAEPDQTQVMMLPAEDSVGIVGPSGVSPLNRSTVIVDTLAWDVLRVLAARYVRTSFNKEVTLNFDDLDGAHTTVAAMYSLRLRYLADRVEVTPESDV